MKKKVIKKTNNLVDARAIKTALDNLSKKLGDRKRAKIRRTKDMNFEVLN